jgi:hypothetical protein
MQIRLKWLGSGIQQPDDDSHVDVDRSVENRDGFLGHHLTEDSSLSLHDIRSPFYTGRFEGNQNTTLVLKIITGSTILSYGPGRPINYGSSRF